MYSYDPPMSLQEAWAPVDEVAGTSVDTFVYGSGAGPAVMHDSRVGEVWGRRFETFDSAWAWRAFENVKSLIDVGHDPLNLLIDRAHEKGMEFFASLRLNHPMDPDGRGQPIQLAVPHGSSGVVHPRQGRIRLQLGISGGARRTLRLYRGVPYPV